MADEKPKVDQDVKDIKLKPPAAKQAPVPEPASVPEPAPLSTRDILAAKLRDLIRSDSSKERHAIANAILDLFPE